MATSEASPKREEVQFTSGGETCAAWLVRPDGDLPAPLVVMAHGFSATREDGLLPFAAEFAAAGIASLAFDYRGFGDSGGWDRQVLDVRRELEDVSSALAFGRTLEGIDPDRICLWGTSFGGGLTLETAAGGAGIRCAIAQVPFTDGLATLGAVPPTVAARLTGMALADLALAQLGRERVMIPAAGEPGTVAAMTTPDALPGFESITPPGSRHRNAVAASIALQALAWRPGRKAGRIGCPLLVQVAAQDAITPPGPAARAGAAAPFGEVRSYPCGHFGVYVSPWFDQVVADQVEFLRENLL
jgi:pimeloyl-ACP methyl ester carboxylesterase